MSSPDTLNKNEDDESNGPLVAAAQMVESSEFPVGLSLF